jgi:hypothetical protein
MQKGYQLCVNGYQIVIFVFKYPELNLVKALTFWDTAMKNLKQISSLIVQDQISKISKVVPVYDNEMKLKSLDLVFEKMVLTYDIDMELSIKGSVLQSGYSIYEHYTRVDAAFNDKFEKCQIHENYKREMLAKASEFVLNMKRFDFGDIMKPSQNDDIF